MERTLQRATTNYFCPTVSLTRRPITDERSTETAPTVSLCAVSDTTEPLGCDSADWTRKTVVAG